MGLREIEKSIEDFKEISGHLALYLRSLDAYLDLAQEGLLTGPLPYTGDVESLLTHLACTAETLSRTSREFQAAARPYAVIVCQGDERLIESENLTFSTAVRLFTGVAGDTDPRGQGPTRGALVQLMYNDEVLEEFHGSTHSWGPTVGDPELGLTTFRPHPETTE